MKTIKLMLPITVFLVSGFCEIRAQEKKSKDGIFF